MLRRMRVLGLQVEPDAGGVVLLLEPESPLPDEQGLTLPITIGPVEGSAIAAAQAGVVPPRPQTHDLALALVAAAGRAITSVEIVALREGVFFAEIEIDDGTRVDARTSDAVALAVRAEVPILCRAEVLAGGGVRWSRPGRPGGHQDVSGEADLTAFREFLDDVDPDDFGRT